MPEREGGGRRVRFIYIHSNHQGDEWLRLQILYAINPYRKQETRGVPPTTARQKPDGGGTESHHQTLWGGSNLQTSLPVTLPNGAGGLWERIWHPPLFCMPPICHPIKKLTNSSRSFCLCFRYINRPQEQQPFLRAGTCRVRRRNIAPVPQRRWASGTQPNTGGDATGKNG